MVKIRYAELPAGLHVATEAANRCTIVYLKPGLTRAQRKDALMVARRSARFGHGPSLPTLDMAFALAADWTRTTARVGTWAIRKHPLLLLPVIALILGIVAASILAAAAVITVPPVSSAQSSGLSQPNIAQLIYPSVSAGHGPSGGVAPFGSRGPVAGRHSGRARHGSHAGRARHGSAHARIQLAMALLLTVPAGQLRGAGSKLTSTESVPASRQVIHGPAGGGNSGHADSSAAISARGSTGHEPAGGRHDGDASGGTATSPSTTV